MVLRNIAVGQEIYARTMHACIERDIHHRMNILRRPLMSLSEVLRNDTETETRDSLYVSPSCEIGGS